MIRIKNLHLTAQMDRENGRVDIIAKLKNELKYILSTIFYLPDY